MAEGDPMSRRELLSGGLRGLGLLGIGTAAGALITEATSRCPNTPSMTPPRRLAYSTIIVPAMVAIPPAMMVNSSLRVRSAK